MMRLAGPDGQLFEMTVLGYEFPKPTGYPPDANWLRIRGHVVHPRGEWTWEDPSLQTDEVEHLAQWFAAIATGSQANAEEDFLETNLEFRLTDEGSNGKSLEVFFEAEARPSWADEDDNLFVKFALSEVDFAGVAEELRRDLARYPTRYRERRATPSIPMVRWDDTRVALCDVLRTLGAAATLGPPGPAEQAGGFGAVRELLGFYSPLGTIDIADGLIRKVMVQRKVYSIQQGEGVGAWYRYRVTYQAPDSAITEGLRALEVRHKPIRQFIIFGNVKNLRWEGWDLSTGLIDRLAHDSSLQHLLLDYHREARSMQITADVPQRCWLVSSEWRTAMSDVRYGSPSPPMSKSLWECNQTIVKHLLATSPLVPGSGMC